jgi:hypothetical protein
MVRRKFEAAALTFGVPGLDWVRGWVRLSRGLASVNLPPVHAEALFL